METRTLLRTSLLWLAATALASGAVQAGDGLQCDISEKGVSKLIWQGVDLLADGAPKVAKVIFEQEGRDENKNLTYTFDKPDTSNPKVLFDAAARKLVYTYDWGEIAFVYKIAADRLGIEISIANRAKNPIADFDISPLVLRLGAPAGKNNKKGQNFASLPEQIGVKKIERDNLKIYVCIETVLPLRFGLADADKEESAVVVRGGVGIMAPGAVFYHLLGLPRVEPGKTLIIPLSLRLLNAAADAAKAEAEEDACLSDIYEAFRKYHQPLFSWPDRRPIGTIYVGNGKGPENNPRNWFKKKDLDIRTAEGKTELKKLFLELAERCIKTIKEINGQGMVLWDPEGQENPHPISYIGDPRMVKILAPEAEDIYPEFFKKFLDAGLRTGCCIRPTQVYFDEKKKAWDHGTGSHSPERNPLQDDFGKIWPEGLPWWRFYPVVERMCRKIEYARKNWGCTIFYVDTNGVFRQFGEKQNFGWTLLDCHIWRELRKRYPDILIIPELNEGSTAQWAYTAQYLQPPYSGSTTPALARKLFPGAFSVCQSVNLAPADWDKRRSEWLTGVKAGDSMFFRGWFGCAYNSKIKSLYDEIYQPGATAPPGLPKTSGEK